MDSNYYGVHWLNDQGMQLWSILNPGVKLDYKPPLLPFLSSKVLVLTKLSETFKLENLMHLISVILINFQFAVDLFYSFQIYIKKKQQTLNANESLPVDHWGANNKI